MVEMDGVGVLGQEREPADVDGKYRPLQRVLVDVADFEVFVDPSSLPSTSSDHSLFSKALDVCARDPKGY
jgi:hypothetical protein